MCQTNDKNINQSGRMSPKLENEKPRKSKENRQQVYHSDNESPNRGQEINNNASEIHTRMELMNKLSTNYVFDDNSYKNYKIEKGTGLSRNKISTQLSKKGKNEDKNTSHY